MSFINQLKNYIPFNLQEEKDRNMFLLFLENNENAYLRENLHGHITVSAWIVNRKRDKVLFCYHNIYDSWSWVGGHADGDTDLLRVALKEAGEETGVTAFPVTDDIFSIEVLPVAGHIKNGEYVSSHVHFNVTYLVEADEKEALRICENENSDVRWMNVSEIASASSEKWMTENIYNKLIQKTAEKF